VAGQTVKDFESYKTHPGLQRRLQKSKRGESEPGD